MSEADWSPASGEYDFQQFPRAWGEPPARALYRVCPEDFRVDELLQPEIAEGGEHIYLKVRKRDQNSSWVAGLLAELASVGRGDVGFCGLKDRFAVTTQWFSIYCPREELPEDHFQHPDFTVLQRCRGSRKLRRGSHKGNRFSIVLREVQGDRAAIDQRIALLHSDGAPNYFAEQRFGHGGNNLLQAQRLIEAQQLRGDRGGRARRQRRGASGGTNKNGIYLSTARSWLFNQVLAERIRQGVWDRCLDGESEPQGPLWGRGRSPAQGDNLHLQEQVLQPWQSWQLALEHSGLQQERRNTRLFPRGLQAQWLDQGSLQLDFELDNGQYATAMLREIADIRRPPLQGL